MYRYEAFYDICVENWADKWQLLETHCYNSLEYAKRKARKICNDYGGCNGVATMFIIYSVNNEYDAGYQIYKSRIY